MERARSALRIRIADSFAPEFDALDSEERRLAIPVMDAAFQFEALEYLSGNAGLDDESMRRALERHVHRHQGRG